LGLFIGISILSLVEIVEILVDFCVICYSVKRQKKYKPQQVVVSTLEGTNNFLQDETDQFNTIRL
jgi:hypothetical protein